MTRSAAAATPRRARSERAVTAAAELLRDLCIRDAAEIDVEAIAAALGAFVLPRRLHGQEARLVRAGRHALIAVDEADWGTAKGRFNAAHELGHLCLGDGADLLTACQRIDLAEHPGRVYRAEAEASDFAAALLMPEALFAPRCRAQTPTLADLRALAFDYRTSLQATALRFIDFADAPCAVVHSRDGVIRWWQATATFPVKLARRAAVGRAARAYCAEVLRWHEAHGAPEPVAAEEWSRDRSARGRTLREHSMALGRAGGALTLLVAEAG